MGTNGLPPPRGEGFTIFGARLEPEDIRVVEAHGSMVRLIEEVERLLAELPDQTTVTRWRGLIETKQEIEIDARKAAYAALKARLPVDQWTELIEDHHEPGDTFLAAFRSHVRYFFRLAPCLESHVHRYEVVLAQLEELDGVVQRLVRCRYEHLPKVESAGHAVILVAVSRMVW